MLLIRIRTLATVGNRGATTRDGSPIRNRPNPIVIPDYLLEGTEEGVITDYFKRIQGRLDSPGKAASRTLGYDSFISYSHALDSVIAQELQTGMERFAKPWYRPRALRVFRDTTSLSANPDLWSSIEKALASSAWLVLMASPQAARSPWVDREVAWWLANKSPQRLLVVLTDGELTWDEDPGYLDGAPVALPPALRGVFVKEPRWVDLRWVHDVDQVDQSNPRLRECVADVAAAVREVPKDVLVGEHIRQHRRTMRLARAGVTTLAVLLVAALVAAVVAVGQRNRAVEQARIATARQLAAAAVANLGTRLDLAQLLAVEAYRTDRNAETRAALLQAVTASPALVRYWHGDAPVTALASSADGSTIVAGTSNGTVTRWRARTGERSDVLRLGAPVTSVAVSENGDTIAATDAIVATREQKEVVLWTADRGRQQLPPEVRIGSSVAVSPSGLLIIISGERQLAVVNRQSGLVTRVEDSEMRPSSGASAGALLLATPNEGELVMLGGSGAWERRTLPNLALVAHSKAVSFGFHSYAEALSDDGRFISFTNGLAEIPVWATSGSLAAAEPSETDPRPDRTGLGPGHYPEALAIATGGNRVAVADTGTITVSDTTQGRVIATLQGNGSVNDHGLQFVAGSDRLVSASGAAVALWDLRQLSRIATTTTMTVPMACNACFGPSITTSPDGRWEALVEGSNGRSGGHAVVRSSNGPPGSEIVSEDSYAPHPLWSVDSTRLFLVRPDGSVEVRAAKPGVPVIEQWQPPNSDTDVTATALSRDGKQIIMALANGGEAIRDSDTGRIQSMIAGQAPPAPAVPAAANVTEVEPLAAVNPDSSLIANVDREIIQLIDTRSGARHTTRVNHVLAVAFTPAHLLVLRADGTLEMWDSHGTKRQGTIAGATRDTSGLVASPTTELAARLRTDGTLAVLDTEERQLIGTFHVPINRAPRDVAGLVFAPNGSTLLVAIEGEPSDTGLLQHWQLSERTWLKIACDTAGRDLTADEWRRYVGDQVPVNRACLR